MHKLKKNLKNNKTKISFLPALLEDQINLKTLQNKPEKRRDNIKLVQLSLVTTQLVFAQLLSCNFALFQHKSQTIWHAVMAMETMREERSSVFFTLFVSFVVFKKKDNCNFTLVPPQQISTLTLMAYQHFRTPASQPARMAQTHPLPTFTTYSAKNCSNQSNKLTPSPLTTHATRTDRSKH